MAEKEQEFYVKVSDLPQFAGRCQAAVPKRKWEYGKGFTPTEEQCSRSAAYRYNLSRFCAQHHPDVEGARMAIEREQKIAEKAYRAAKAEKEMAEWQPIETAPEFVTILTQHVDDLYPVAAFRCGDYWGLEREGPEDTDEGTPGKWGSLLRPPTHWQPLPPPPGESA